MWAGDEMEIDDIAKELGLARSVVYQYVSTITADIFQESRKRWGNAAMRNGDSATMHGGFGFWEVLWGGGAIESERRKPRRIR